MPTLYSLRRGIDWVQTALYDPNAKKADGVTNRFNRATDFVVKYTLKAINPSDPNPWYKNPVRRVAGSNPVQYCVEHDDGTIYILDGYDPYTKSYQGYVKTATFYSATSTAYTGSSSPARTSTSGWTSYNTWCPTGRSFTVDRGLLRPKAFYQTVDTVLANPSQNRAIKYYYINNSGSPVEFTHYYWDPNNTNAVEVVYNGVQKFLNGRTMRIAPQFSKYESYSYHSLFFQGEKFVFAFLPDNYSNTNITALGSGINPFPVWPDLDTENGALYESSTSLNFSIDGIYYYAGNYLFSSDALINQQNAANNGFLMSSITNSRVYFANYGEIRLHSLVLSQDGMYQIPNFRGTNTTVRADICIQNGRHLYTSEDALDTARLATLAAQGGVFSCYANITPIQIPTVTVPSFTVSLVNAATNVAPSTTTTLYKGVDWVYTGMYNAGQFATDLVVKCSINGVISKYPVRKANGSNVYCVSVNNTIYMLNGYDPYERCYTQTPWATHYQSNGGAGQYYVGMTGFLPMILKSNKRFISGFNVGMHSDQYVQPAGYSKTEVQQFELSPTYTCTDGTTASQPFTHFSYDDAGTVTMEYGGVQSIPDSTTVAITASASSGANSNPAFTPYSHQYHTLFFANEKANVFNCTPDALCRSYPTGRTGLGSIADYGIQAYGSIWGTINDGVSVWPCYTDQAGSLRFTNSTGDNFDAAGTANAMPQALAAGMVTRAELTDSEVPPPLISHLTQEIIIPLQGSSGSGVFRTNMTTNDWNSTGSNARYNLAVRGTSFGSNRLPGVTHYNSNDFPFGSTQYIAYYIAVRVKTGIWRAGDGARFDVLRWSNASCQYVLATELTLANVKTILGIFVNTTNLNALTNVIDAMPSLDLLSSLQTQISTLQTQLLAAQSTTVAVLNQISTQIASANTALANNLSDPAALNTQISTLQTALGATTDTPSQAALTAQIALLQQIQVVQTALAASGQTLTATQSQMQTILGVLQTATGSVAANLASPGALSSQITSLQTALAGTTDTALQNAYNVQIQLLQTIQSVQTSLSTSQISLTDLLASVQQANIIVGVSTAISGNLTNATVLQTQITSLEDQIAALPPSTSPQITSVLNAQLSILQNMKTIQTSLVTAQQNLTNAENTNTSQTNLISLLRLNLTTFTWLVIGISTIIVLFTFWKGRSMQFSV